MSWLPHIHVYGTTSCPSDDEGEYEGWTIEVVWFGWLFEFGLLRRERRP